MRKQLELLLVQIITSMGVSDVPVEVTMSQDTVHGDYTTNIAMRVAKQLKKSPMDIALQVSEKIKSQISIVESIDHDQNSTQKHHKASHKAAGNEILQAIDRIEVAPPGFINIFLTEASLSSNLHQVLKEEQSFGTTKSEDSQRVTVEFTDPNPFKEFHIGHLYSNSVGEAVCRLLESQGHTVRRVNYQGDVGMHVAKSLYGLFQQMKKQDLSSSEYLVQLEQKPLNDRIRELGQAYAAGAAAFEEDEKAASEMKELNKLGFIAAQRMWEKEKASKPVVDYVKGASIDEEKLEHVYELYSKGRAWSLEYFETIYKRLGTQFAGYYFESFVGERGVQLVREHIADGVFEESDGAVIYRGEKKGLHTRVFLNQLGLPTYEAKELGLAPTKYKDWAYDRSIIVTGNEINEYFKVLLAAMSDVAPELAAKTRHMGHGMVRKSDGSKMSSRSGMVLTGLGLLQEVKASIYTLLETSKSKYEEKDREEIAEKGAIAAVKYSLLRVSLPSDVAFDVSTSISFDGDSGPYLLYTYARCKSVIRKAGEKVAMHSMGNMNSDERALARLVHFYPEVVAQAARELAPNVLCTYLFVLAQAFNAFYQKHPILEGEQQAFRLTLTAATAQVLHNGLHLLGIETVERM